MVTGCAFGASATFSSATHIIPAKSDDDIEFFFVYLEEFEIKREEKVLPNEKTKHDQT